MVTIPEHLATALRHVRDGNLDAALASIARAEAAHDPLHLTLAAHGAVEMRRHAWAEAERYFVGALEHNDDLMLHMNLGMARFEIGRYEQALLDFREVLNRDYSIGSAWHKLGACHAMLQDHINALACLDHAVGIAPDNPECHHGMSVILSHMGIEDGALWHARRAQELKPDYHDAVAIEAFTLLRMGDWAAGWPKFESRWFINSPVAKWDYRSQPLFTGNLDDLKGKKILLRGEQGFGDTLQFCRYVPLIADIAKYVTLEVPGPLERLLARSLPVEVTVYGRDAPPPFDYQTSLMSLPLLFRTVPENVPPAIRFAAEKKELGVKAGVCWRGGARPTDPPADATDRRRSMTESQFGPIIDVLRPVVVLQYESLETLGVKDWADTADIIANLNMVVCVDTAVAHLAASLGIETWVLSRFDGCWRWMNKEPSTPWYSSMRIYRQPRLGLWKPVIDQVVDDLNARK